LLLAGDALYGFRCTPSDGVTNPPFTTADRGQYIIVTGTNAGMYRVNGVFTVGAEQAVVLQEAVATAGAAAATVDIYGVKWVAKAFIEGIEYACVEEPAGHEWRRLNLCFNISKAATTTPVVLFSLGLEFTTP